MVHSHYFTEGNDLQPEIVSLIFDLVTAPDNNFMVMTICAILQSLSTWRRP